MSSSILNVNIKNENDRSYPIMIGESLFEQASDIVLNQLSFNKAIVVTNTTVAQLYRNKFNFDAEYIIIEDGEEFKSFETYKKILDSLVNFNVHRKDILIALGGGVVGDIAGFAASTYMRGINFVQVPTTLLAQVDSSVGGKVAINHPEGKNLIGAFYQPKLVLTDVDTLSTLDKRQFKSGLGEVLKYAFIEKTCNSSASYTQSFFDFLANNASAICNGDKNILIEMIRRCCELKAAVVNADEKEQGLRAILNFGHTFAHAIEKCTNYVTYTHGEAVAIGMKMAFELSQKLELINKSYFDKANSLIEKFELETDIEKLKSIKSGDFLAAMSLDKKNESASKKIVLATNEGECCIQNIDNERIIEEIIVKYVN